MPENDEISILKKRIKDLRQENALLKKQIKSEYVHKDIFDTKDAYLDMFEHEAKEFAKKMAELFNSGLSKVLNFQKESFIEEE